MPVFYHSESSHFISFFAGTAFAGTAQGSLDALDTWQLLSGTFDPPVYAVHVEGLYQSGGLKYAAARPHWQLLENFGATFAIDAVELVTVPETGLNDRFDQAEVLDALPPVLMASTVGASMDFFGDPRAAGARQSLWWRIEPEEDINGQFFILDGQSLGAQLAVFQGETRDQLVEIMAFEESDRRWMPFRAGRTYYLALNTRGEGSVEIGVGKATVPTSDDFDSAASFPITGEMAVSTAFTTLELGEPVADGLKHSLWHRLVMEENSSLVLRVESEPAIGARTAIFRGKNVGNLVSVPAIVEKNFYAAPLQAGEEYFLQITSKTEGPVRVHLEQTRTLEDEVKLDLGVEEPEWYGFVAQKATRGQLLLMQQETNVRFQLLSPAGMIELQFVDGRADLPLLAEGEQYLLKATGPGQASIVFERGIPFRVRQISPDQIQYVAGPVASRAALTVEASADLSEWQPLQVTVHREVARRDPDRYFHWFVLPRDPGAKAAFVRVYQE